MNGMTAVTTKTPLIVALLILAGCQTIGTAKPVPVAVSPEPIATNGAAISGGGLLGSVFGNSLTPSDRQLALNAEYKALEYGKAGEAIDWAGSDVNAAGQVKAMQPYRVGSQDCRQYSHELMINGAKTATRGTACRNNDGSWTLLE